MGNVPWLEGSQLLRPRTGALRHETVRRTMEAHKVVLHPALEQILETAAWARREAAKQTAPSLNDLKLRRYSLSSY